MTKLDKEYMKLLAEHFTPEKRAATEAKLGKRMYNAYSFIVNNKIPVTKAYVNKAFKKLNVTSEVEKKIETFQKKNVKAPKKKAEPKSKTKPKYKPSKKYKYTVRVYISKRDEKGKKVKPKPIDFQYETHKKLNSDQTYFRPVPEDVFDFLDGSDDFSINVTSKNYNVEGVYITADGEDNWYDYEEEDVMDQKLKYLEFGLHSRFQLCDINADAIHVSELIKSNQIFEYKCVINAIVSRFVGTMNVNTNPKRKWTMEEIMNKYDDYVKKAQIDDSKGMSIRELCPFMDICKFNYKFLTQSLKVIASKTYNKQQVMYTIVKNNHMYL